MRKKFTRTTKGANQQVITGKPIAITTDVTLALFLANAPTGEIGVYDGLDAIHNNAITSTEQFYIAVKKSDGSIKRTTLLKWADVTASRKTYVAPVKATGSIGWNGTSGALNLAAAPAAGKNYEIAVLETTEGNQPFPTWNYEHTAKPGEVEMDIIQQLVKKINDANNLVYKSNDPLVTAKAKAVGTYGNFALTGTTPTLTFTYGSTTVTLGGTAGPTFDMAVNDFLSVDAAATPTSVIGDVYKVVGVTAGVSFELNRPYQGATQTFTEAESEGTRIKKLTAITATGIVFTAIDTENHFVLVARQEMANATIVNLSAFTKGNGTPEQVQELELEGNTFDGNTAGNTLYGNEAYGNPDRFAKENGEAETYDIFTLSAKQDSTLIQPYQGKMPLTITLAVPKSAGGLTASLNTLFGL